MTSLSRSSAAIVLPRLVISDGALEALKWFALLLMTIDHVNKYLLNWSVPWMFALGRMAMPVFAVVLAYNLARPGALQAGAFARTLRRLAVAASIATVPFSALGRLSFGNWWPLNILFTLFFAVTTLHLWQAGGAARKLLAITVFAAGGALGEFFWPALALFLAAHAYARTPSLAALVVCVGSTALLALVNSNFWALCGLGMVALSTQLRVDIPRKGWIFYVFYPAHLTVLWGLRPFFAP